MSVELRATFQMANVNFSIKLEGPWTLGLSPENAWSVEWNFLWNFGKVHHEDQFCEIILNLGQWFREDVI